MDIKFANVVVEIMIENWRQIFCGEPFTGKRLGDGHRYGMSIVYKDGKPESVRIFSYRAFTFRLVQI